MAKLSRFARWLPLRCCLWLLLAIAGSAHAQTPASAPERQVKAAYLLKFAAFVEWPEASFAHPDSALQIGVAGSDALAEQLERMAAGRSVNGHPVTVRRLSPGAPLAGLHMLFLDNSLDRGVMATLLDGARGQSLLTVSDADEANALGCMINFIVADAKLRFDVVMRHVATSRLRISARMLAVAHRVQGAT